MGGAWKAVVPSLSLLSVPLWCLTPHCSGVRELQGVALATWTDVLLGRALCHLLSTLTPSAASPKLQAGTECCPGGKSPAAQVARALLPLWQEPCCPGGPLGRAVTVLPRGPSGSNATDLAGHRAAGLRWGCSAPALWGWHQGGCLETPMPCPLHLKGFLHGLQAAGATQLPRAQLPLGGPGLAGGCPRLGSPVWGDSHLVPRAKLPCSGLLPTPVSARTPSPHTLGQLAMRARACVSVRGASMRGRVCLNA
ncbi:uncharacterized protein LOC126950648 [Macaca thibetana thibetana]|uniref:uncharacterized protein LOC126950648 n=1 Tax=Macaca thibetana thibetana TaxID=257877 RepID=UPI0021BC8D92|nr:uncharacterized protein LOC126950648 [Macaca thibetana thibetana]